MIYFLVICALVALISFTDFIPKLNKIGDILCILLLGMLAGFRNVGGIDYAAYVSMYETGIFYSSIEKGYALINSVFSYLGVPYNIFLFIISLASVALIVSAYRKLSPAPKMSLMLYIATYFLFYNMCLNRQMIAVALFFWVVYFWDRNKIYSCLILLTAYSFHKSVMIVLPFLITYSMIKNKKFVWAFLIVSAGFGAMFLDVRNLLSIFTDNSAYSSRLSSYIYQSEVSSYAFQVLEYVKILLMLAMILPNIKKIMADKKLAIWLYLYGVYIVLVIMTREIEILFRLAMYFDLSFTILLPAALYMYIERLRLPKPHPVTLKMASYFFIGIISVASILYRASNFSGGDFLGYKFFFLG